ncbi:MAG: bacillithiol biosynthesis cysteine-adding enzyme BshC [Chitinophagaceae bacterium]
MDCTANRLPYRETGYFSKIILDYIDQADAVKPFFSYAPSLAGIQKAIDARKKLTTNREVLVAELKKQYNTVAVNKRVQQNIESLLSPGTFTITTAHQNNIFSGPLYFIYKILHAIKLADHLKQSLPQYNFVPVFYIGSEDADLDELNHIYLAGEKIVWNTKQTGAVGRMKIDKELTKLIGKIEGQVGVLPNGKEIVDLIKEHYKEGTDVQTATFQFVNALFSEYGLVVLLPDNTALKKQLVPIFEDDLLHQTASGIIETTVKKLENAEYKAQANPREINLFYLKDNLRERIEQVDVEWQVVNTDIKFTKETLLKELQNYPERFSPNVILRGLYQATILPDIAFIGGGGEIAYWLQLKDLFNHYKVPFPVLVLRNSFMIVEKKWQEKINKLGFTIEDMFLPARELLSRVVMRESKNEVKLNGSLTAIGDLYEGFKKQAAAVDITLDKHVDALKSKTIYRLQELEKKMLRAEKRKFADQQRQIESIKHHLFQGNGLQERKENISYYYAKWGREFIEKLLQTSLTLEQEFVILNEA